MDVAAHEPALAPGGAARVVDAAGGLLLPGLHDHHVHVAASVAALLSVRCGPPEVHAAADLAARLAAAPGEGWLRGVGYHESVAGMIDRHWIDRAVPDRPVRIQHRGGRMWVFNSVGLEKLRATGLPLPPGLERESGEWTGRLFDEDDWLRRAMGSAPPSFATMGSMFARWGVTGLTDMNPQNDMAAAQHFANERASDALPQRVLLAGRLDLGDAPLPSLVSLGPVKVHLHEAHLPDYDALVATVRAAHEQGRAVAVHCVTETELVFTLAALREARARAGDRIEHASVAPDGLVEDIAALGLAVVAQPNFVAERGDAYLADIPAREWPYLYRLRAFLDAGVALAGGSDTPFGSPDPWAAMAAAVSRRTARGQVLGAQEALTPEEALGLFLADPEDLGRCRVVARGAVADLCLLEQNWAELRTGLAKARVRATLIDGRLVHDTVDQAPA